MVAAPVASRRVLAQMLQANQVQQAIYVAAKLGIADLLSQGPRSSHELAQDAGAHAGALYRLLRVLASVGIFAEDDQGRFALTPQGELLRTDRPDSMAVFALWSGGVSYQTFGQLEYSVRTGKPSFEQIFGLDFFEYLAQHPQDSALFDALMSRHTAPVAAHLASYDFPPYATVIDVGGGPGELLAAILRRHLTLQGVVVDQDRVLDGARSTLEAVGVADRCRLVSGDVRGSVPCGGDVYLVKSVLHGLNDADATRVLANCRRAMADDARLLVIELVVQPGNDPSPSKLMDLLMLVGCHGRERTEDEFRALFAATGFQLTSVEETRSAYSIIEGRPR